MALFDTTKKKNKQTGVLGPYQMGQGTGATSFTPAPTTMTPPTAGVMGLPQLPQIAVDKRKQEEEGIGAEATLPNRKLTPSKRKQKKQDVTFPGPVSNTA